MKSLSSAKARAGWTNEIFLVQKVADNEKSSTFAPAFRKSGKVDSVAQQVEHNTFNVGVLGSSPSRVTSVGNQSVMTDFLVLYAQSLHTDYSNYFFSHL